MLRASHRALAPAPYARLGFPFHRHFQADLLPVNSSEPFELVFDLLPTAYRFTPGKQLLITVTFADADNFDTPAMNPASKVHILRDDIHPSLVELPIRA